MKGWQDGSEEKGTCYLLQKPADLNLIPEIHIKVERGSSDLYMYTTPACMSTCTHIRAGVCTHTYTYQLTNNNNNVT